MIKLPTLQLMALLHLLSRSWHVVSLFPPLEGTMVLFFPGIPITWSCLNIIMIKPVFQIFLLMNLKNKHLGTIYTVVILAESF